MTHRKSEEVIAELKKEDAAEMETVFKDIFRRTMFNIKQRHGWVAARTKQIRELERIQKDLVILFDRGELTEEEADKIRTQIELIHRQGTVVTPNTRGFRNQDE